MLFLERFIEIVDACNDRIGKFVGWLCTAMVLVVFYDTVMRYAFNKGNVGLQELEWHLFSVIFLIGAAYTLKEGGHVRVDILFLNFSERTKAWIDFLGSLIFLIPFCLVVIYATQKFVGNSWAVKEISPDPGGLPARYLLKAMIPTGFILLIFQGLSETIKNLFVIIGHDQKKTGEK